MTPEDAETVAPSREHALALLRQMVLIRRFDEKSAELYTVGKIRGFLHLYIGEEAVAVGAMQALTPDDNVVATYHEHGQALARGLPAGAVMAEMFGRANGCSRGRGGSMHLFDVSRRFYGGHAIVGGGLPVAVGLALADAIRGRGAVTACFFGDGAVAEGEFHESLNISSVWKLPIVFVCENNQYAANNAIAVQHPVTDVAVRARSYDLPGLTIDGNDVMAVREAARTAVDRARRGEGPSLIECKTYRWHFHAMRQTPPPETRPAAEIAEWKSRDPIARFATDLTARSLITDSDLERMRRRVQIDLEAAVAFAENSPFPDPKDILMDMFAA